METKSLAQGRVVALISEEISSSLRHEVKNHLSAIRNANYCLRTALPATAGEGRGPPAAELFEMIDRGLDAATGALDGVVRRARTAPSAVDVATAVGAALAATARPPGVRVVVAPEQPAVSVLADAEELELALCALLENAFEAVGAAGSVHVRWRPTPTGGMDLEVVDDGPGLPEAVQARALEPFYTTKEGHAGLGLTLVKRVAARWSGTLELDHAEGGGVRALLRIDGPPAQVHAASSAEGFEGTRVLMVDDSEIVRTTLAFAIESAGYGVVEAGSLAEARARLEEERFALVILDYHLGDGRGPDLLPELRARWPKTREALCSGDDLTAERAPGFDLVIEKASDPEVFLQQIAPCLPLPDGGAG